MGKLVEGIHGHYMGKVGSTIGSSWRGIPYIKSRGLRTKPATEGELVNRFIFSKTQKWLFPITDFLRVGFKNYTLKSQGVNAAKSYLYKNALIKNGFDSTIDPTLMKVSFGDLALPNEIDVACRENELIFSWETASCDSENQFDQIMLLAYDIEKEDAAMKLNGQFRRVGSDVLDVGTLKNFVVYAAFVSADRESQSQSVYLGSFSRTESKKIKKVDGVKKALVVQNDDSNALPPVPANQLSLFGSDEKMPAKKEKTITKKGRLTYITNKESAG